MKIEVKEKSKKGIFIEFAMFLLAYLIYFRIIDFFFLDLKITSEVWSISLVVFCSLLLAYITLGREKQNRLFKSEKEDKVNIEWKKD